MPKRPRSRSPSPKKTSKLRDRGPPYIDVEEQVNLFCGAHALNNIIHFCPQRQMYRNLLFTFDNGPEEQNTINLNKICRRLQELNPDERICEKRGEYDYTVLVEAARLAGLHFVNEFTQRSADLKNSLISELHKPDVRGILVHSKTKIEHWLCVVLTADGPAYIDSIGSKITKLTKVPKAWDYMFVVAAGEVLVLE